MSKKLISLVNGPPTVQAGGDFTLPKPHVLVFSSPHRVDRTERQRSVFSLASFDGGAAVQPLTQVLVSEKPSPLRKFPVPALLKPELRRLLSDVGLDAYSIFGDPDSLGKSLEARLDLSDLKVPMDVPPDNSSREPPTSARNEAKP